MNDKISALIDSALDEQSARVTVDQLNRDANLRKEWGVYCLIGDTLRGEQHGSSDLVTRVMSGLDSEATVLAPRALANQPSRPSLWNTLMPIAASVMGVAAVGLVASTMYSGSASVAPGASIAAVQRLAPASSIQPVMVSESRSASEAHREYVFVHQAMTSGGPMPAAVQYVRTVSALPQERDR